MIPERFAKLVQILDRRQTDLTVLLDGVHKPHNFSAILRTCDAVGILHAHVVPPPGGLPVNTHAAQGSQKWVKVHRHRTLDQAVDVLKGQNTQILAAHLDESTVDFREIDYTRPTAILLGTERYGVSKAGLAVADQLISVPMMGMVQSLNVSVACALILYEAQRQRSQANLYGQVSVHGEERAKLLFEWAYPKLARMCRDRKHPYPELDAEGNILGTLPGTLAALADTEE